MVTEEEYLKAKAIVDQYRKQQIAEIDNILTPAFKEWIGLLNEANTVNTTIDYNKLGIPKGLEGEPRRR